MTAREPQAYPAHVSPAAAQQLSPAFPARAAWGTAQSLRAWQAEAMRLYLERSPRDFLAVATPGAGKTTFALRLAVELLGSRTVRKLVIICPTQHLKYQWAEAAARVGIHLDPAFSNSQGRAGDHFDGVALTYAQVGANPQLHQMRTAAHPTLVILDEIHHAGDALTWGDGVATAFGGATRRLSLTGTPFRSDTTPIPFVDYHADEEGVRRSRADFSYGYGQALQDGVVRPVLFHSYSGNMHWRTSAGEEYAARLGEPLTKDQVKQAWRTALDPAGKWMSAVLAAADQRLSQMRRQIPDAGGLVIASDQEKARAYAHQLHQLTGQRPTLVLSDDPDASERIDDFTAGTSRWMVAVRMVSEGVDVPRLTVGVYATSAATPLFFAQAIGRFVRARRRGETASVFLPSVAPLLDLAGQLEAERDHVLNRPESATDTNPEEKLLVQANRTEAASQGLLGGFEALSADAEFDMVLFDGGAFGTGAEVGSVEEQDYLGIPGLLDPEQVTSLLRARQAKQVKTRRRQAQAEALRAENSGMAAHRRRAEARKELSRLVAAWSRRTGSPHSNIHADLRRRCGGPEIAAATTEEIEARSNLLRRWFVGKR